MTLTNWRLLNLGLLRKKFENPEGVVEHLGAVQAQDFPAARWSLGVRLKNSSDESVEKAFNEGKFLRTHIMRPTWHFVMPEDLVWMQELTSKKVKAAMASYNRKLELTDEVFEKATNIIVRALESKNYLTRQQLKTELANSGLNIEGVQRLAHLVFWPELDGLICSGPKIGKQLTYALVSERAPRVKKLSRQDSLAKLTYKYFSSHGPAQIVDFSWWSGLNQKEIAEGLSYNQGKLFSEKIDGKTYWFSEKANFKPVEKAHLLSIYDEYTIAYKDRSALGDGRYIEKMIALGNAFTSVITINGLIVGHWKRILKKERVEVTLNLYKKSSKEDKSLLKVAVLEYSEFLKLPVVLKENVA